MRRREFIAGLGGSAAWPFAVCAQQPKLPVIGFVRGGGADGAMHLAAAFRRGLGESGFIDGQNLTIEYRWANGQVVPATMLGRADEVIE